MSEGTGRGGAWAGAARRRVHREIPLDGELTRAEALQRALRRDVEARSSLVRPERIDPPAFAFEARRSSALSYGGRFRKRSSVTNARCHSACNFDPLRVGIGVQF